MDAKDEQRLNELAEIEETRQLTDEEQHEVNDIARREYVARVTLTRNKPKVIGLKLTNNVTGEVSEWTPERE